MKRDQQQRRAYALCRLSGAIDRYLLATTSAAKKRAMKWVKAWAMAAGLEGLARN
ncbi:hypothetical protein [Caballeronia concitans]|uniref:Uncharacterized protein n=1 Tax=Caballeronia concitans TaxID=1777133 RepID=A0A658R5X8_9BURK|nr:hypothetical protein [Caballeronia concitans]SAL52664.1 hypothetical protein AWB72_05622 [Caballeronia concitans]